jgi:hypothetical protein
LALRGLGEAIAVGGLDLGKDILWLKIHLSGVLMKSASKMANNFNF